MGARSDGHGGARVRASRARSRVAAKRRAEASRAREKKPAAVYPLAFLGIARGEEGERGRSAAEKAVREEKGRRPRRAGRERPAEMAGGEDVSLPGRMAKAGRGGPAAEKAVREEKGRRPRRAGRERPAEMAGGTPRAGMSVNYGKRRAAQAVADGASAARGDRKKGAEITGRLRAGGRGKGAARGMAPAGGRAAGACVRGEMASAGGNAAGDGPRPRGRRKGGGARTVALSVTLVAAFGCLLWVYTATGVLNVREVEVRGNRRLDGSYLRVLSGITSETHLLKMDVKAVERALLTEPYVEEVRVSRRFPATVLLSVREREPAGFVRQNGRCVLVAGDGTVLESLEQTPTGMAEIRASGLPLLVPGERVDAEDFLRVSSLLLSLDAELEGMVDAAGCSNGALYLEACGTRVLYGDLSDLERKNSIARLALGELGERYGALEYIDVSFPDRPVIKPVYVDGAQHVDAP